MLSYGPFICFLLTLLLVVTGLIVFGACKSLGKVLPLIDLISSKPPEDLRRDTYEDNSFPLPTNENKTLEGPYNLHSLRNYAKSHGK